MTNEAPAHPPHESAAAPHGDRHSPSPRTLVDVLAASRGFGSATQLVYRDERWTFAEHYSAVAALAHALVSRYHIHPGDRVAVAMRNYPEFSLSFWACQAIGAVTVPVNAWWTGEEMAFALEHSGAALLIADAERIERLARVRAAQPCPPMVVVRPRDPVAGADRFTDLIDAAGATRTLPRVPVEPHWDSTILYTSGTTGRPRGAVHSHRNHVTHLVGTGHDRPPDAHPPHSPPPALLATMPLFHISQLASLYLTAAAGQKLVLMYRWDAREAVRLIQAEDITDVNGVPMQINALLDAVREAGCALDSLTGVGVGATAVPADLVNRIVRELGPGVVPRTGYGMTETTSSLATIAGQEYLEHPDSVGFPLPFVDVRVVDEDGGDVEPGQVGELWVRGPNVIRGYWDDPSATRAGFTDGWHRTGDLVRQDGEGRLHVVDRIKDVVIRAGENVYSAEVEAALQTHPDVAAATVVGLPHPELGEEVAAVVRPRAGRTVSVERLRAHVADRIAYFKVPSVVVFTDEDFPRTPTGKVMKREVRRRAAAMLERGTGTAP